MSDYRIGVDVGGTSIKAAVVDVTDGRLAGDRVSTPTPTPPTMPHITQAITGLIDATQRRSAGLEVGVGLPVSVTDDGAMAGIGLHPTWDRQDVFAALNPLPGLRSVINDADAAAVAEARFGELANVAGTSLLLTLGTGIGTALVREGTVIPNLELGFLPYQDGLSAEGLLSAVARERRGLTWAQWGAEFSEYLVVLCDMFQPSKIVIGGGVSDLSDIIMQEISAPCAIACARFGSAAGIVGAAVGQLSLTAS